VPRRIFELKREETAEDGENSIMRSFARKREGKSPLGRPRRRCEDNIKMNRKD
jgi:hypothetical protein